MKSLKFVKHNLLCLLIFVCCNAQADTPFRKKGLFKVDFIPIQIGVTPSLSLFAGYGTVYGLTIALPISVENKVYGLSIGVVGLASKGYGVQLNLLNSYASAYGFQSGLAGLGNEFNGLQANIAFNKIRKVNGMQLGVVNSSESVNGVQLGILNSCFVNIVHQIKDKKKLKIQRGNTVQLGIVNASDTGYQLGVFNRSENSKFQVGLLNYNKKGFLTYFPFFNFAVE